VCVCVCFDVVQQSDKLKRKTCLIREAPTLGTVSVEASVSKVTVELNTTSMSVIIVWFDKAKHDDRVAVCYTHIVPAAHVATDVTSVVGWLVVGQSV